MIYINDTFSAKPYNRGWELHRKVESLLAKKGYSVDVTFYATFRLLALAVMDKQAKECAELSEIIVAFDSAANQLMACISENNIA